MFVLYLDKCCDSFILHDLQYFLIDVLGNALGQLFSSHAPYCSHLHELVKG